MALTGPGIVSLQQYTHGLLETLQAAATLRLEARSAMMRPLCSKSGVMQQNRGDSMPNDEYVHHNAQLLMLPSLSACCMLRRCWIHGQRSTYPNPGAHCHGQIV